MTVSVSPSTSLSLPSTEIVVLVLMGVAAMSSTATGASLTGATVMGALTDGDTAPSLSVAVKSNAVVPLKFAAGTKLNVAAPAVAGMLWPAVTATPPKSSTPLAGRALIVKLTTLPSISLPPSSTGMPAASSSPLAGVARATGASLTALTSIVIWFGAVSKAPALSCTLKLKLAWPAPLAFGVGVKTRLPRSATAIT